MRPYECDPNTELTGQTALALTQNINYQNIQAIIERHHMTQIDPQKWYPLQDLLDILKEIAVESNSTFNFVSIGMAAVEVGHIPPEIAQLSLEEFLHQYDKIYKMRHRHGDAGSITTEKVAPNHLRVTLKIPYPDDVFYGVIYAYARRFLPTGTRVVVKYDETQPRMAEGGPSTILHVMWG